MSLDTAPGRRYLDLLKKSLLNEIHLGAEVAYHYCRDCRDTNQVLDESAVLDPEVLLAERYLQATEARQQGRHVGRSLRNVGFAHTMIGRARLDQLDVALHTVLREDVPGDFVECGVWRGGATIFMRGVLAAHSVEDRKVWVADSFEGLPVPTHEQDAGLDLSRHRWPQLAVDVDQVRKNFERYDLLDDKVVFLKGWFRDTLPAAAVQQIALLRLDGDLYESTWDALAALYPKVAAGGYVIVDDYGCLKCCRDATEDYRREHGILDPISEIDWTGVFWRKSN